MINFMLSGTVMIIQLIAAYIKKTWYKNEAIFSYAA